MNSVSVMNIDFDMYKMFFNDLCCIIKNNRTYINFSTLNYKFHQKGKSGYESGQDESYVGEEFHSLGFCQEWSFFNNIYPCKF